MGGGDAWVGGWMAAGGRDRSPAHPYLNPGAQAAPFQAAFRIKVEQASEIWARDCLKRILPYRACAIDAPIQIASRCHLAHQRNRRCNDGRRAGLLNGWGGVAFGGVRETTDA